MKIIYLGTPEFAVYPLKRILESGYEVVAVVSQPDRPVGRKMEIKPTPVKQFALERGLKVLQFERISDNCKELIELNADIMITCAYGQILSQQVIDICPLGIYNIHASLLPLYRGASPIQSSILNGDKVSGVTVMKTELGLDSGDILLSGAIEIGENETYGELSEKLSVLGGELIIGALDMLKSGNYKLTKQNSDLATYCKTIKKADCLIDWSSSPAEIVNKIRGLNPAPVAFTCFKGKRLKCYLAEVADMVGEQGKILAFDRKKGFIVGCNGGSVKLIEIQAEGGKKMNYSDFVLGAKLSVGDEAEII